MILITHRMKDYWTQAVHTSLEFTVPATKMFRRYMESAPDILNEAFPLNPESLKIWKIESLRNQETVATRPKQTVHYG